MNQLPHQFYHHHSDFSVQVSSFSSVPLFISTVLKIHSGKMDDAGDGDDEEADDDGGDGDIESVPAQTPRAVVVPAIIAVPRHDREDQGYNVDGVRRTKAGEDGQTEVAVERRRRFLFLYRAAVKKCTPTQGTFHLRMKHSKSHCTSRQRHTVWGRKTSTSERVKEAEPEMTEIQLEQKSHF